jgi:uncharacterized protein YqjF (DUF2071 family)
MLRAEWRKLVMLHYPVNPDVLLPYLPYTTELETWNDRHYISMVGFLFTDFRVNGIRLPFHQHFVEVNLRFYVRQKQGADSRRGVVFIKEFVDKPIITLGANFLFNQHYHTLPMRHTLEQTSEKISIAYHWKVKQWHEMQMTCAHEGMVIQTNSMEEFFTDQAWGFAKVNDRKTLEYNVEHMRWYVYDTKSFIANIDFEETYGASFAFLNRKEPEFAFMAEGSPITLKKSRLIL